MKHTLLTLAILLLLGFAVAGRAELQVGFYRGKCGNKDVENIIRGVVTARFLRDPTLVAALLRMQFHDCSVDGCDASLLLDGPSSEKTAPPNLSVRGYDILDQAKEAVERACPGVVSCADIIIAATRDAVDLEEGGTTYRWGGETARSRSPATSISPLRPYPLHNPLHTVGTAHCSFFSDRLYNFNGTGGPDPTMDSLLVATLRLRCPQNASNDNTVNLDQNTLSSNVVDNSYHRQILMKRGVLKIDQSLALDGATRDIVKSVANGFAFSSQFNNAMIKMGAVEVLTGTNGEIRKSCRAVNTR